jgi:hypothetical protein
MEAMKFALSFVLGLSLLAPVFAQSTWFEFLPRLQQYLALTDTQVQAILRNNQAYNAVISEKQLRIAQVDLEIQQERRKENIDAMAIGLRVAEIESHCRFLKGEAEATYRRNREVLTDAQRTRLAALEEAAKLIPVIQEAQSGAMLPLEGQIPGSLTVVGRWIETSGFLLGGTAYGCTESSSPLVFRNPFPAGSSAEAQRRPSSSIN